MGCRIYDVGNGQWNISALRRLFEEVLTENGRVERYRVCGNSYPVADELMADGVPVMFVTGYQAETLPERFATAPAMMKPLMSNRDRYLLPSQLPVPMRLLLRLFFSSTTMC